MKRQTLPLAAALLAVALAAVIGATVAGDDRDIDLVERLGRGPSPVDEGSDPDTAPLSLRVAGKPAAPASSHKAAVLIEKARRTTDPDEKLMWLERAIALGLSPDDRRARKLAWSAHLALAERHAGIPHKRAHHLTLARQAIDSPAEVARLDAAIAALGAAAPVSVAVAPAPKAVQPLALTPGVADTCDDSNEAGTFAGTGDFFVETLTVEPADRDWYALSVATGDPGSGLFLRIETVTDTPDDPLADDTRLWLYRGCDAGTGAGLDLAAFDDDGSSRCNGPTCLQSRIDTPCLGEGTWWIKVSGWEEIAPADNIDLEIEVVGHCVQPRPDGFEPDNARADASKIGNARPPHGTSGDTAPRVRREIQAHNVFPAGDEDWVKFRLGEPSLVRLRTACGFATADNGHDACVNPEEFDTIVTLWAASPWSAYGLCNQSLTGVPGQISTLAGNACESDLDCDVNGNGIVYPADPDDLTDPVPGLPACLPWGLFPPDQRVIDPVDNPLLFQDDADPLGGNLGSDVTVCLPRTAPPSHPPFDWYVRTSGWSASGEPQDSDLEFDYALRVENSAACRFEQEPNGDFPPIRGIDGDDDDDDDDDDWQTLDATRPAIHGIYDFSSSKPDADVDLFRIDVPEAGVYVIETDGHDPIAVDTFIELWVGPDANGEFVPTGHANDDVSPADFRSRIEATLLPPCQALGLDCASKKGKGKRAERPSYWVKLTSAFVTPNFPYELRFGLAQEVLAEFDDYGDCGSGLEAVGAPGSRFKARSAGACDLDGYRFSLAEASHVRVRTMGPDVDTTVQLVDCQSHEVLGCDDDGNPGVDCPSGLCSQIEGCLPGGRDYCVRVRPWSGGSVFDYEIEIEQGEACEPVDPPDMEADGNNACADSTGQLFNTFAECDASFDTCQTGS